MNKTRGVRGREGSTKPCTGERWGNGPRAGQGCGGSTMCVSTPHTKGSHWQGSARDRGQWKAVVELQTL